LEPSGQAATVEEGSDQSNAELIAVLVLTRPGERELVPAFGVNDPTFDTLSIGDVIAGVDLFGPGVEITSVEARHSSESEQEVDIGFE
jgi:hypothetical protein